MRGPIFTAALIMLTACGSGSEFQESDQISQGAEENQPVDGTDNQPDESADNQPVDGTDSQPDEGADNQPDEGTDSQPDEGTDNQPDEGTDSQPDEGTDSQPDEGTDSQPDEGTDNQPDEGTDSQPEEGADNQPEEGTDNQPDGDNETAGETADADLFLIIGQSNSAGRDTNFDHNGADAPSSEVLLFTDGNTFETATQPLNEYSGVRKTLEQGVNLGLEFGKSMNLDNGRMVYIVANSRGGTKVTEWKKDRDTGYFENSVQRVKDAEAACSCTLAGILWHQGEGNVSSTDGSYPAWYFSSLAEMIEEYRDALGDVPFIVGQLFQVEKNENFNNDLRQVANADFEASDVDWVSSENLTTLDGTHFDAASMRIFGGRYATVMQRFID